LFLSSLIKGKKSKEILICFVFEVIEKILAIREKKSATPHHSVPNVPVAQHAEEGAQQTLSTIVPLSEAHKYEFLVKYKVTFKFN
jgi:hypothetical protein